MEEKIVNSLSNDLQIIDVFEDDDRLIITCKSSLNNSTCPHCGKVSNKVHQKFIKLIQDLPFNQKDVTLKLMTRVFKCDNSNCKHYSFTENFNFVNPSEKKSNRMIEKIVKMSMDYSCRKVAKLLNDEGAIISKATVNNIYNKYK